MSKEKRLVPIRRFTEFKNNWKQHRLEEIVSFLKGRNLSWVDIHEEGVNECILYGNLYTDYGMVIQNINYSTNTSVLGKILSKYGDVLIPSSDTTPTGLARASSLEKDNVILGGDINVLRPKSDINGSFLSYNINYNRKQLLKLIKGTTVKHIYNSDLKDVKIKLPSLEEQKHLTRFFKTMDNLINLQQQKTIKLKNLKSGYLNDMFAKEAESVPKLRFVGFEEPWATSQLGNYTDITTGKLDANAMVKDGQFDFYTSGIKKYRIDEPAFKGPAITIAGNGATVGYMHLADGEFNAYQRTYVLSNFKSDRQYLYIEIERKLPKKIQQEARMGNIPYIVLHMLTDLEVVIPNLKEQQKIGNLFRNLDKQIKLQEDKLEKLKQMKQAYLNEMFV